MLPKSYFSVLVLSLSLVAPQAQSQILGKMQKSIEKQWVKSENGLIIAWQVAKSTDANSSMIHISAENGSSLVDFDVLRLVPEAKSVSIHDVSARQGRLIGVSATYVKTPDVLPAPALLILDFSGNLKSAVALDPSREIISLAVDDHLNIWSLAWHSGGKNPDQVPLVTEYDKEGSVLREFFKRTEFPPHEEGIEQGPNIGSAQTGCIAEVFWFWLPESTDLVEINTTTDAVMKRTKTKLPDVGGQAAYILRLARESSGEVVADTAVESTKPNGTRERSLRHYMWSSDTKSWAAFDPTGTCPEGRLIGVNGDKHLYMRFTPDSTRGSICSFSRR